jgi:hypothetical protein
MRIRLPLSAGIVVVSCLFAGLACSGSSDGSKVNGTGADGSGGNGSGAASGSGGSGASSASGGVDLNIGGGVSESMAGETGLPTGDSSEICDGIDNDHDGIIDNVDKNGDGVCDCLLIATLGVKGTSGQGDVFATWLSSRSDLGATDLADQTLTPELLDKYEVIVAQDVHKNHGYSDAEVSALSDWVSKGGGFMTLIGYSDSGEAHNVNKLLAPFGMSYTDQQILQKKGNSTIPITMWAPHPIDMGVSQVGVDNGYPVQGLGTTIATGGGFDVAKVQEVGKGHVFLWGDEWITYDSEWNDHPDYQVQLMWLNTIKWLTVAGQCQVTIPPNPPK